MIWRNSIPAEVGLILLVLSMGYFIRTHTFVLESSTWYATMEGGSPTLTLPGFWFFWVSNPIIQFLLLRWLYRLLIWTRFLWQVSRIPLSLMPTHPDRNCGLGFLGGSAYAYSPLLTALEGGVPILVEGQVIGAVGVSGVKAEQDAQVAKAGIVAL